MTLGVFGRVGCRNSRVLFRSYGVELGRVNGISDALFRELYALSLNLSILNGPEMRTVTKLNEQIFLVHQT